MGTARCVVMRWVYQLGTSDDHTPCHQNSAKCILWLIINIIDWNNQTKGCSETTLTDDTQNYLYIIGSKFHILNHEDFPDINKKRKSVDRKFMVSLWYYSKSMDILNLFQCHITFTSKIWSLNHLRQS